MKTAKHWFPGASPDQQPTPWWYYGRALYVSRTDYKKIFFVFLAIGIPLGLAALFTKINLFWYGAFLVAGAGFFLLFYSLFGLYRQYGHPAAKYFSRMLKKAGISGNVVMADIHIGTYRHTYQFANHLPEATIYSVDCWEGDTVSEQAISDVRSLEPAPTHEPRLKPLKTKDYRIPLADASCDVVVFGFGTHEIPKGEEALDIVFAEAIRILKPGGKLLLFEHGIDFHNYLIFGPVIYHVTKHEEWMDYIGKRLADVKADRLFAVNMITALKK